MATRMQDDVEERITENEERLQNADEVLAKMLKTQEELIAKLTNQESRSRRENVQKKYLFHHNVMRDLTKTGKNLLSITHWDYFVLSRRHLSKKIFFFFLFICPVQQLSKAESFILDGFYF